MTAANQAILDGLQQSVTTAKSTLDAATKAYNDLLAQVTELRRQADYHRSRGDDANLQIVNAQLAPAQSAMDGAKNHLNNCKAQYDVALAAYVDAQNKLLTPAEKEAILIKAQSEAASATTEAEAKVIAQKTTQYLIWGAIGLVIIVVAIVIYKKKFAK